MTFLRFFDVNEQNIRWNQRMLDIAQHGTSAINSSRSVSIVAPMQLPSFGGSPVSCSPESADKYQLAELRKFRDWEKVQDPRQSEGSFVMLEVNEERKAADSFTDRFDYVPAATAGKRKEKVKQAQEKYEPLNPI